MTRLEKAKLRFTRFWISRGFAHAVSLILAIWFLLLVLSPKEAIFLEELKALDAEPKLNDPSFQSIFRAFWVHFFALGLHQIHKSPWFYGIATLLLSSAIAALFSREYKIKTATHPLSRFVPKEPENGPEIAFIALSRLVTSESSLQTSAQKQKQLFWVQYLGDHSLNLRPILLTLFQIAFIFCASSMLSLHEERPLSGTVTLDIQDRNTGMHGTFHTLVNEPFQVFQDTATWTITGLHFVSESLGYRAEIARTDRGRVIEHFSLFKNAPKDFDLRHRNSVYSAAILGFQFRARLGETPAEQIYFILACLFLVLLLFFFFIPKNQKLSLPWSIEWNGSELILLGDGEATSEQFNQEFSLIDREINRYIEK